MNKRTITIVTKQFHEHSSVDDNSLFGVVVLKVGLEKKTKQNIRLLADFEIVYFFQSDHCVYHARSYP